MLQTQISRLGGINFPSLPINRSLCPFISTSRDGAAQHRIPVGPHYYPNRFETPNAGTAHGKGQNYATSEAKLLNDLKVNPDVLTPAPYKVEGWRGRQRPARVSRIFNYYSLFSIFSEYVCFFLKFNEHVNQAQLFCKP